MIVGGPIRVDSQRIRNAQIREAYGVTAREIMEVEAAKDTPLIQFRREEQREPRTTGDDALVITALLANYEVERVFIDSGSSAGILFGEAYDRMQLGDVPLDKVDTSLYGFTGEIVHPNGMISLPLILGTTSLRKLLVKFLVVDIPSSLQFLPRRSHTLSATPQTLLSNPYHMKIKFPMDWGVVKYRYILYKSL
ncbi:UNVERIFIED_CONTAM: hypothetical protein Sangu_0833800 [Sesamum angustifolium]|uniref:Uncharacterized protein n=1 Tax=Sesamum angustifolium TaxID=2727405 RepID=A0AAW2PWG9_9LAMI